MTTHRRKVLPVSAFEHAPVTCPACYSVPKQPCRRFKMVGGILKLFGPVPVMHPQRRIAAGLPKQADSQRRGAAQQVRRQAGGKKTKKRAANSAAGPDTTTQ
ncbi:hypothetical protein [Micromonospora sp. KC721]|uniref:hypothetical protein n=1 Tax=Micromonospora sp. KC721 TaxID=2530380 RepID=UPI001044D41F|nr:hypothetical protein [Micromonospora sp. KC721]TDB80218.1 hypothetical protein E1182_09785 [Micromonospora sp. KC721]